MAIRFDRFKSEVLDLYTPPLRAPATYRQIRQVLEEFGELRAASPNGLGKLLVTRSSDITAKTVGEWIRAHPARSAIRTRSLLSALRSAVNYGVFAKHIESSPFAWRGIDEWIRADVVLTSARKPRQHCTASEIRALFARVDAEAHGGCWLSGRTRAVVYLFAYTGLRAKEGLHLKRSDINLRKGTLKIEPKVDWRVKTPKSAAVLPIAEPLIEVLGQWLPRAKSEWAFPGIERCGPWIHGCAGYKPLDKIKAAGKRAGIRNLTFMSFRKTVMTLGKGWGFGQLEAMSLLRHTSSQMLKYYDEESIEELRKAIAKINYGERDNVQGSSARVETKPDQGIDSMGERNSPDEAFRTKTKRLRNDEGVALPRPRIGSIRGYRGENRGEPRTDPLSSPSKRGTRS